MKNEKTVQNSKYDNKKIFKLNLKLGFLIALSSGTIMMGNTTSLAKSSTEITIETVDVTAHQITTTGTKELKEYQSENNVEEEIKILENERIKNIQNIIYHYCEIYQISYPVVEQRLSELTNNYSSSEFLNNNIIPNVKVKGETPNPSTLEELIMVAVRCCKYSKETMKINQEIETNAEYISNMDYLEQINYYSQIVGIDSATTYGILKAESNIGQDTSRCVEKNNYGNLMGKNGLLEYDNETEGLIELILQLKKYKNNGLETVEEISTKYDPYNTTWATKVNKCIYDGTNKGLIKK